ncbi:TLD-domain-containing protein [Fimicolochytrium jonesii]|uniref:TLD-domain-containing protein n=1 Tax=Fimicolochytrium jonesii TaxID=1396493 RepID=UPI0022FDE388|nr:TLD-domain-containing protein [Fimicolochytrium jonesii]KAI8825960.1 TLD-domain-containing protein [Fimicolochytrium jonesii]
MGQSASSHSGSATSPTAALKWASEAEREVLLSLLRNASASAANEGSPQAPSASVSSAISQSIPERLRKAVAEFAVARSGTATKGIVTMTGLATAARILLLGDASEKQTFVNTYAEVNPGVTTKGLVEDIAAGVGLFAKDGKAGADGKVYSPTERFVTYLLGSLAPKSDKSAADAIFSSEDTPTRNAEIPPLSSFQQWFPQSSLLQELWTNLFQFAFLGTLPTTLPALTSTLLTIEDRFILCTSLASEFKGAKSWPCLFSTQTDGASWTVFAGKVQEQGSVLFVIRDKDQNVFGAFAAEELVPRPKFVGDSRTFVFTLRPQIGVFSPAGYNANYQYYNTGAATFPNGIGFGGQLDYFGLYISSTFENGHSKASPRSSTFDSPRLSAKEEFQIDFVEAFLVKPKEVDDRLIDPKLAKKSILNDDVASSLLEMSGKRMYSKEVQQDRVEEDEET